MNALLFTTIHSHKIISKGFSRISPLLFGAMISTLTAAPVEAKVHRLTTDEFSLYNLISSNSQQKRRETVLDPILCKVARERAEDMARRGYFAHVNPDGHAANFLVRRAGFLLPAFYDGSKSGNNIESLAMTTGDARQAFALWMNSGGHRNHVLGGQDFYKQQCSIGVGVFRSPKAPYYKYYVLLSAPPNASPRPPTWILKNPKGKVVSTTKPYIANLNPRQKSAKRGS